MEAGVFGVGMGDILGEANCDFSVTRDKEPHLCSQVILEGVFLITALAYSYD